METKTRNKCYTSGLSLDECDCDGCKAIRLERMEIKSRESCLFQKECNLARGCLECGVWKERPYPEKASVFGAVGRCQSAEACSDFGVRCSECRYCPAVPEKKSLFQPKGEPWHTRF